MSPVLLAYVRTVGPLSILLIRVVFSMDLLKPLRNLIRNLFSDLVPIDSLLPAQPPSRAQVAEAKRNGLALWRQFSLAGLGMVESAVWMTVVGFHIAETGSGLPVRDILLALGMVVVWVSEPGHPFATTLNAGHFLVVPVCQSFHQTICYTPMVDSQYLFPLVCSLSGRHWFSDLCPRRDRRISYLGLQS